jgi:hypothetical protein
MAGGVRVTSVKAIQRFFYRLTVANEAGRQSLPTPQPRLSASRRKSIAAAEKKLAQAGI